MLLILAGASRVCAQHVAGSSPAPEPSRSSAAPAEAGTPPAGQPQSAEQAKDKVAVSLAGLEGTLKMYEAILKSKPKAQIDFLEQLITKRDKGELKAYVEDIAVNKCKGGKK